MKKLSFYLKLIINCLLIVSVLALIYKAGKIAKLVLLKFNLMIHPNITVPEYGNISILIFIIKTGLLIYLLTLSLKFRNMVYKTGTSSFFTEKNGQIFQTVGNGLIYYGVARVLINVIEHFFEFYSNKNPNLYNIKFVEEVSFFNSIPIFLIAIFLLIIAHLIKDGYRLKNENDLTI